MKIKTAILAFALLLAPLAASADYLDVIVTRLGECSLDTYLEVVEDFRKVMTEQKYSYTVEISVPLINNELDVVYWLGRTKDFETFGKEFSRWSREIMKDGTPEAAMNEKFNGCGVQLSRSGHVTQ